MQDQTERCLDAGIDTATWNNETSEERRTSIERELCSGDPDLKLIYTTPESLKTPRFMEALQVWF